MKFWEGGSGYVSYSESRALSPHPNRCRVGFVQNSPGLAACPRLREENPIGFPASPRSPCLVYRRLLEAKYCFMSEGLKHAAGKRTLILRRCGRVCCRRGGQRAGTASGLLEPGIPTSGIPGIPWISTSGIPALVSSRKHQNRKCSGASASLRC